MGEIASGNAAIARVGEWLKNPWQLSQKPFHVIENIYFVGTSWVSVFLLKTEKGLALIDCAMQETFYLIVDNIHKLGFDPHDIKYLFLSHGHFDHCGAARALQEMSGCEIWVPQDDAYFFTERRDLIGGTGAAEFRIDHLYNYNEAIDLGDVQIRPVHCPGHTPGTTSLFLTMEHNGRTIVAAMHGGLGAMVLAKKKVEEAGYPADIRETYLQSIDKVIDAHVDVLIPSHVGHAMPYGYDFYDLASKDDGTGNIFIDTDAWRRMLSGKKQEMLDMLKKEAEEEKAGQN